MTDSRSPRPDHVESRQDPVRSGLRLALSRAAAALEKLTEAIATVQTAIGCISIAAMVLLLVGSSIQRYALGSPIPIVEELAGLLFVTLAFMAITEGFTADRQVRIQLVWRYLPQRLQGWAMIAGHFLSIFAMVMIIVATFNFALFSYQVGARTNFMEFLLWPWMMLIPGSFAILVLATFARILVDLDAVLDGRPVKEALAVSQIVVE